MRVDLGAKLRTEFPIFSENPQLVYLDNAATTQKPDLVVAALLDFYTKINANVHRGLYPLSEAATELYELSRRKVAKFINAQPEEIIFTPGTTWGMNMIASMLHAAGTLTADTSVLLTDTEHHSSMLPWLQHTPHVKYIPMKSNFTLDLDDPVLAADYEIAVATAVSNVTGAITDIGKLRTHTHGKILVVDAAQAVAHSVIDVQDWNADVVVFGAHKMYGPLGVGVLYVRQQLLETLPPVVVGGGMIDSVTRNGATWAPIPARFEAGTPPVADAVGLAAAVDYLSELSHQHIQAHERLLRQNLVEQLSTIPGITLFHPPLTESAIGCVSFSVKDIHPHDLAQILGEQGIAVRAGHHCTHVLHRDVLEIGASTRASIAVYNSTADINALITGISKAQAQLA